MAHCTHSYPVIRPRLGAPLLLLCAAWLLGAASAPAAAELRVPIHVAEPSGVARQRWPVTSGIPFPQGALREPVTLRLVDGAGAEMPLQTRVLARWGDKSVRWLLLDFQVDLQAEQTFQGWLEVGQAAAAVPQPLRAAPQEGGGVQVETGALTARFAPDGKITLTDAAGRALFDAFCDSRIELIEFSTHERAFGPSRGEFAFKADPGDVVIEEQGPMRCVVRLKGWHHTAEGKKFSPTTLRFELYRGLPLVRVLHTFVMSENPNEVMIKRIELHSALAGGAEQATCILGGEQPTELTLKRGDAAYVLQQDVGELHYPHMNQRQPQCQVVRDMGWKDVLAEGRKAQGWMRLQSAGVAATFALPHMREQWPKSLRGQGDGKAVLGLWPDEHTPWDLRRVEVQYPIPGYFREYLEDAAEARHWRGYMAGASMLKVSAMGLARTHEALCHVDIAGASAVAGRDLAVMAEKPLYAYVNPQWYCDSLALGRMWPHDPENFPGQEEHLERWIAWLYEQQEKWKWYGVLDWGDVQYVVRSPAYSTHPKDDRWWRHSGKYGWFNSGHSENGGSLLQGLLTQWARTGDRRYMDFAMARARHLMDVDTVHYYPDPEAKIVGGMRRHGGFDHFAGAGNPAGAHTVNNGFFEFYYLTGYQRARDVAQLISDAKADLPLSLSETRSGITDTNSFMYSYNLTHDSKYLERVRTYLANHAQRQEQQDWPKLWISYFTTVVREAMTCGDEQVQDLAREVFLTEHAALGRSDYLPDAALAFELDPSAYNYWMLNRALESGKHLRWPPVIMNQAGVLCHLPHFMWAVMEGRRKFGAPPPEAEHTQYGIAQGNSPRPVDLTSLANANPWAVDVFDPASRDTTDVSLEEVRQGIYRFDFGPLSSWDPASIPVSRGIGYPTRLDAPKPAPRNLVGLPFGARFEADGVPFHLLAPGENAGRAVLVLRDGAEHEIALPPNTQAVHVLGHISGRAEPRQVAGAEYEFVLADGTVHQAPLVYMLHYEVMNASRGAMHARQTKGKLKHFVYRPEQAGAVIRSMRLRDLGRGHDLLVAAVTVEVSDPAAPWPTPAQPAEPAGDTLIYGGRGLGAEHNNVGFDTRAQQGLADIQATLPDWQTNLLLTDCMGILETLNPGRFIAHVPNGEYQVTAWFAQPYNGCKNVFYVKAQNQVVFDRTVSSYGVERGRVFHVQVTEGKFELEIGIPEDEFEKNAHWGVRAIELRRISAAN